jgi:hypothetical protein
VLFLIPLQFVYLFCNLSQVYPASNTVIHKLYFSMEVCYNIFVFLSHSRQMAGYYKKLDYGCLLPHSYQLSVHCYTAL